MEKTNVMRILDRNKIHYSSYYYGDTDAISGAEVAAVLHQNPKQVFKTLVTVSSTKNYYVFMIPVLEELNLKKAAKVVCEKSLSMLPFKELFMVTGYIHGGCSPIGMKKELSVVISESAKEFESIIFSAGKIGYQVEVEVSDLIESFHYLLADII